MKFKPNGELKLYDFVEDLLYSLSKVFTKEGDDTKLSFVKSRLPSEILPILSSIPDYSTAKTAKEFMKVCRHYDIHYGKSKSSADTTDKVKISELVTLIKDLVKQQNSSNTVAAVAQTRGQSPSREAQNNVITKPPVAHDIYSPGRSSYQLYQARPPSPYSPRQERRSPSPSRPFVSSNINYKEQYYERNNDRHNGQNYHNNKPNHTSYQQANYRTNNTYQRQRSPSPTGMRRDINYSVNNNNNTASGSDVHRQNKRDDIYNNEVYYKRFGVPPYPCTNCQLMHWERHCPNYLN